MCKDGIIQVIHLEFVTCIEDWFHVVFGLHYVQPGLHVTSQLGWRKVTHLLHIKDRRKVAWFQMNLMQKELGLLSGIHARHKEMIRTAYEIVPASLIEILVEILIREGCSLGGFDDDKADGIIVHGCITQFFPIDACLIMTDIYASHVVSLRINSFAVHGFPSETEGTNEVDVEYSYICCSHQDDAQQHRP